MTLVTAVTCWILNAHSELVEICDVDLCLKRPLVTLVLLLDTLNTLSWSLSFEACLKTWIGPSGLFLNSFRGSMVAKAADETCLRSWSLPALGFLLNRVSVTLTESFRTTDLITFTCVQFLRVLKVAFDVGIVGVTSMLWDEKLAPLLFVGAPVKTSGFGGYSAWSMSSKPLLSMASSYEELELSIISTLSAR